MIAKRMGRPPQISRAAIVKAATAKDAKPTLKGIADVLGVTPQALYRHVANFADVQKMIFEEMGKRSPYPTYNGETWRDWLVIIATWLHGRYKLIPRVFEIAPALPEIAERYEVTLAIAKAAGYDETDALITLRLVVEYTQAYVGRERRAEGLGLKKKDFEPLSFAEVLDSQPKLYPLLRKAAKGANMTSDARFQLGVCALIDGLLMRSKSAEKAKASSRR